MLEAINPSAVKRVDQSSFLVQLDAVLKRAMRSGSLTGLAIVDLENFNRIATRLGYGASDEVLMQFGTTLASIGKREGNLFRIGEHKFALLLDGLRNEGHAVLAAKKIERLAKQPIRTLDGQVMLSPVIGVALFPEQADTAEALLQRAELALASALEGDVNYHVYCPGVTQEIASLWGMETELNGALENDEFELLYQPKIDLRDKRPMGAEALMRWKSAARGQVSPDVFIPIAEKTGIIRSITWFALNTALRQSASWPKKWFGMSVAVNVSAIDIRDVEFVDFVSEAVGMWGGNFEKLTLEITESAIVTDPDSCFGKLSDLRKKGVRVSIDDFGTGYSALSYFKNIPADELKIDKSFVAGMLKDRADEKIVRSIVDLAHDFEIKVVAEGVEDVAMLDMLRTMGCDYAQGYLFERPLPHEKFMQWLARYDPRNQP